MRIPAPPLAVVVVTRHGDRAPGFNFFAGSPLEVKEKEFWASHIWKPDDSLVQQYYSSQSSSSSRHDPFGHLTNKGAAQMRGIGNALKPLANVVLSQHPDRHNDNDVVYARSTAYSRTTESARALLSALVPSPLSNIRIQGALRGVDNLNPWDSNPQLREATKGIENNDAAFKDRSAKCQDTKQILIQHLPAYRHDPTQFHWVWACDYFVTRDAYKSDPDLVVIPQLTAEHRQATLDMATFQFARFFTDRAIQTALISPLVLGIFFHFSAISNVSVNKLKEQYSVLARKLQSLHSLVDFRTMPLVTLLSGHDVTLLPLLCLFGVVPDPYDMEACTYDNIWPTYASRVQFELYPNNHLLVRSFDEPGKTSPRCRVLFDASLDDFQAFLLERLVKTRLTDHGW